MSCPQPNVFFDHIKKKISNKPISLSQNQVDGFNILISEWNRLSPQELDHRHLAYVLATAWHETAYTMQPIAEYGKGRTRVYGKKHAPLHSGSSKRVLNNHIYYGRGYVQLTWFTNYLVQTEDLKIDIISNPELALVPKTAANIAINGMIRGRFTGKKLTDYIARGRTDFINARRIINGIDKAREIARHAEVINQALILSGMED